MTATMANFFISLVDYTCILLVVVYCIIRTHSFYYLIFKDKDKPQKQAILALFFGAASCYGVLIAAVSDPTLISISMIGPITGALTCGFWVGART